MAIILEPSAAFRPTAGRQPGHVSPTGPPEPAESAQLAWAMEVPKTAMGVVTGWFQKRFRFFSFPGLLVAGRFYHLSCPTRPTLEYLLFAF